MIRGDVDERLLPLLYRKCIASGTDWTRAGITGATARNMIEDAHTSLAGGDCRSVAGEIAASQKIERVSLSRPAASERLATSISLAVGRRQRGAAGHETGLTGSVVVSQRRCPARRYHYYLIQYHAVIARQDAHDEAQTDAMASQFLGTGQGSSVR